MKKQNALTVRTAPDLSELKRAKSLVRLTQSVLGTPVPARNRTDEHGRKQGRWTEHNVFEYGYVHEGEYVDDKPHGHWVLRDSAGGVYEGECVDGKRHGKWVFRYANGDVAEGPFVDGKQHGKWVGRIYGDVIEMRWENGKAADC